MNTQNLLEIIATRPILDRKDLARRFCRSLRTIDRWALTGRLPRALRCSGKLWTPQSIDRMERGLDGNPS